jgi:hypothetical protein
MVKLLNKDVTNADGVIALGLEGVQSVHHMLVKLNSSEGDELDIGALSSLVHVVERGLRLIAIPRTELGKKLNDKSA